MDARVVRTAQALVRRRFPVWRSGHLRHVPRRALTRVVVDAENVRRSAWPNVSAQALVDACRDWAERERVELLVVFDGTAPEDAADLVSSGARSADDVIDELDGPFWLISSDRGLRERVGGRAERIVGGGTFLRRLGV